jgi:hypothetical protein
MIEKQLLIVKLMLRLIMTRLLIEKVFLLENRYSLEKMLLTPQQIVKLIMTQRLIVTPQQIVKRMLLLMLLM